MTQNPRQLAFLALRQIQRGAFADVALDKALQGAAGHDGGGISGPDRRLLTELVYGTVRRQRTLDALIDQLAQKPASQQPPELRLILHLGLYQLYYLGQVPDSAAVNTTVDLAKKNGMVGLAGFVNGLLRQAVRDQQRDLEQQAAGAVRVESVEGLPSTVGEQAEPSPIGRADRASASSALAHRHLGAGLPLASQIGVQHSYPDWIVQVWLDQFGPTATEQLCECLNQPPSIDLRVNTRRCDRDTLQAALLAAGVQARTIPHLDQALRLPPAGPIQNLPGFQEGWWIVQDSSAQLVSYLLDPQPGEVVVDACAAPGGKTLHMAELMQDRGQVWAVDRTASRLKKLQQNVDRLGLGSIQTLTGDSRDQPQLVGAADRVLIDAPCSGLGTLNRHADARWRQTPKSVGELALLQRQLLDQASSWVKPGGVMVYSTCTLHPIENERLIQAFLADRPDWQIAAPAPDSPVLPFMAVEGWAKVLPYQHAMDGFFMVKLQHRDASPA
jgi:16S rRNA (cytosine967-C5)-methyltransferase